MKGNLFKGCNSKTSWFVKIEASQFLTNFFGASSAKNLELCKLCAVAFVSGTVV